MTAAKLERAGALAPRDRMWAAIRRFGLAGLVDWRAFSGAEIAFLCGERVDTVMSYLRALTKAGYLVLEDEIRPPYAPRCELTRYALLRDVGVDAPHVNAAGQPVTNGIGHKQMWTVMRKMRGPFDWRSIALAASTPAHPVAELEASTYLRALARAGYLRQEKRGAAGRPTIYVFVRPRDTGPRAPMVTKGKAVVDGNTGETMQAGVAHG